MKVLDIGLATRILIAVMPFIKAIIIASLEDVENRLE